MAWTYASAISSSEISERSFLAILEDSSLENGLLIFPGGGLMKVIPHKYLPSLAYG